MSQITLIFKWSSFFFLTYHILSFGRKTKIHLYSSTKVYLYKKMNLERNTHLAAALAIFIILSRKNHFLLSSSLLLLLLLLLLCCCYWCSWCKLSSYIDLKIVSKFSFEKKASKLLPSNILRTQENRPVWSRFQDFSTTPILTLKYENVS